VRLHTLVTAAGHGIDSIRGGFMFNLSTVESFAKAVPR